MLLCGHGTRDADGVAAFETFITALRECLPGRRIAHGFLELSRPSFAEAVAALYLDGVREIVALPVLLFNAGHAKRDLPTVLNRLQGRHEGLRIRMGRPLGLSAGVVETAGRLVTAALPNSQSLQDTALLVVGRGTSDPDANGDVAKLARLVAEQLAMPFVHTAFIAVTSPSLAEGMALFKYLPFGRVVVLPTVLFDGVLHKRLVRLIENYRPVSLQKWHLADPFATDTSWLCTFAERLAEVENGSAAMNCQLCNLRYTALASARTGGCCSGHHHAHSSGPLPALASLS